MGNNVRRLRVAFLLTPKELAARIGADASDVERIEADGFILGAEWIDAIAGALGVPGSAVTDPAADIEGLRAASASEPAPVQRICPIGARYAILALVAKLGGGKLANRLDEDDVARAVRNLIAFTDEGAADGPPSVSRQTLALRITVLAILQAQGFSPQPRFEADLEEALPAAAQMMSRFSRIGPET